MDTSEIAKRAMKFLTMRKQALDPNLVKRTTTLFRKRSNLIYDDILDRVDYLNTIILKYDLIREDYHRVFGMFVETSSLFHYALYREVLIGKLGCKATFNIMIDGARELSRHSQLYDQEHRFDNLWKMFLDIMQSVIKVMQEIPREYRYEGMATAYILHALFIDFQHDLKNLPEDDKWAVQYNGLFYELKDYFKEFFEGE